jgi:hypothetical protein
MTNGSTVYVLMSYLFSDNPKIASPPPLEMFTIDSYENFCKLTDLQDAIIDNIDDIHQGGQFIDMTEKGGVA